MTTFKRKGAAKPNMMGEGFQAYELPGMHETKVTSRGRAPGYEAAVELELLRDRINEAVAARPGLSAPTRARHARAVHADLMEELTGGSDNSSEWYWAEAREFVKDYRREVGKLKAAQTRKRTSRIKAMQVRKEQSGDVLVGERWLTVKWVYSDWMKRLHGLDTRYVREIVVAYTLDDTFVFVRVVVREKIDERATEVARWQRDKLGRPFVVNPTAWEHVRRMFGPPMPGCMEWAEVENMLGHASYSERFEFA